MDEDCNLTAEQATEIEEREYEQREWNSVLPPGFYGEWEFDFGIDPK